MMQRTQIVWISAAAFLICYASVLAGMMDQWWSDEDMGHGFLVPLVIGFILWRERERWMSIAPQPSKWGWALLAAGAAMQLLSVMGAGLFAGSVALVISLAGVVLLLGGWTLIRTWSFPLLLTLFMLPKLAVVYNQTTLPLQLLASRMAAGMLTMAGVGVIRAGNILEVGGHQVAVAEACNGIRYLLPLGFIGAVFAYLADSRVWMRIVLLISAIPIAVVANAGRVAFSAYSPKLAEGNPHLLLGAAIFVVCLAWLFVIQKLSAKMLGPSHA